jgi:hypothetical protein
MPEQTLPLKPIKAIVDVPDQSLWIFAALVAALLLVLAALAFWLVRRKKGRIDRKRKEALRRLDALDFGDTKKAVYDFSLLGHFVLTPETEKTFKTLLAALEPYKFKKEVPPLPEELKTRMLAFIGEAHRG